MVLAVETPFWSGPRQLSQPLLMNRQPLLMSQQLQVHLLLKAHQVVTQGRLRTQALLLLLVPWVLSCCLLGPCHC